jgi:hypothetical protein
LQKKKGNYTLSIKSSSSEIGTARRSTVLILPLQYGFPDVCKHEFFIGGDENIAYCSYFMIKNRVGQM